MADNTHWLDDFVRKYAWGILGLLVFITIFYANTLTRVEALEESVDKMESVLVGISENQTQILLIQQDQLNIKDDITDIKLDIATIKNSLGEHTDE